MVSFKVQSPFFFFPLFFSFLLCSTCAALLSCSSAPTLVAVLVTEHRFDSCLLMSPPLTDSLLHPPCCSWRRSPLLIAFESSVHFVIVGCANTTVLFSTCTLQTSPIVSLCLSPLLASVPQRCTHNPNTWWQTSWWTQNRHVWLWLSHNDV